MATDLLKAAQVRSHAQATPCAVQARYAGSSFDVTRAAPCDVGCISGRAGALTMSGLKMQSRAASQRHAEAGAAPPPPFASACASRESFILRPCSYAATVKLRSS